MDDNLTGKLENIRGFSIIRSEESQILVDISDFGMDTSELICRLSEHGIEVHECGRDWGQNLARRNIEDVLKGGRRVGRRDCEYYPCHFEGQDCTFCFCPFYPCNDERTGGRYVESSTGKMVWSCVDCTIVHEPEVAQEILVALMALKPGEDTRSVFESVVVKHLPKPKSTRRTNNPCNMTLIEAEARHIQPTYTRQPILLTRSSGARVWDAEGREYIDCVAGVAVLSMP
jgi:Zn-finger protein